MKRPLSLVAAVLIFGLLSVGTAFASPPPDFPPETPDPSITDGAATRAFRAARAKWLKAPVLNYRLRVTRSCFCPSPNEVEVTVRRGRVVRTSVRGWSGPRTVAGMFQQVHLAIKAGVPELRVNYHPRFGFVKSVWVDHIKLAADDEIGYGISGFRRLR
ncbi:MAG: DUF6174 domain-containing protein [Solirubrobacterales bacterium]|nr:DUF6174 domain-containing protein [Solirubrobacterales bacterium]